MNELSHIDDKGRASMVDVSDKNTTERRASAQGSVSLRPDVLDKILDGDIPKGDVFQVARIAAIQAAKKTSELIPLCHPLKITNVKIDFKADRGASEIVITAVVKALDRTGVEMEALTAAAVAALTIYDMCKAVQRDIVVGPFFLLEKEGGKSGHYKKDS
ncbi:MAG: cyclic pyranopterin monophosphate synthase MoaC [bacterium]